MKHTYKPYIGAAGPSPAEIENNDLALCEALTSANIPHLYHIDEKWCDRFGTDHFTTICIYKNRKVMRVSYDRWGYVAGSLKLDQVDFDTTLWAIKKWYFGRSKNKI